jgi:hypothetical protein
MYGQDAVVVLSVGSPHTTMFVDIHANINGELLGRPLT